MSANPTEAERRLWALLRDRRLAAFKFRRQQVIEPYIADFACFGERLIIEADGSQHADDKDDARRDAFLRSQGFRVLRFWNNQVLGESEAVPPPSSPPSRSLTLPPLRGGPLPLPKWERG
jgi:very-short-patch-repair endonuclease